LGRRGRCRRGRLWGLGARARWRARGVAALSPSVLGGVGATAAPGAREGNSPAEVSAARARTPCTGGRARRGVGTTEAHLLVETNAVAFRGLLGEATSEVGSNLEALAVGLAVRMVCVCGWCGLRGGRSVFDVSTQQAGAATPRYPPSFNPLASLSPLQPQSHKSLESLPPNNPIALEKTFGRARGHEHDGR